MPLARVEPIAVREWVSGLLASGLSPSRTRQAYVLLSLICKSAVESGRISSSPCVGVHVPRARVKERIIIDEEQIAALADACTGHRELI
jgi:hypothetical protein